MNRKALKTLFATVLCLGALASPAFAQMSISLNLGIAPPPPRYEVVEEVRPGWFWAPGFWFWEGNRHHWSDGHWERVRPGYRWEAPRWEARGDMHHYAPGRWISDGRRHDNGRYDKPGRDHSYNKPGRGPGDGNPGRGHDRGNGRGPDFDRHDNDRGGRDGGGRGHGNR